MLTLRTKAADVAIDVPQDRDLTVWPKSLLLTCAVARMSPKQDDRSQSLDNGEVLFSVHVQCGQGQAMQQLSQSQGTWIDLEVFDVFHVGFTQAAQAALDLGNLVCLEEKGRDFLEGAGASKALQQPKPVPMQIRIVFTNMDSVPEIPLVLSTDTRCRGSRSPRPPPPGPPPPLQSPGAACGTRWPLHKFPSDRCELPGVQYTHEASLGMEVRTAAATTLAGSFIKLL